MQILERVGHRPVELATMSLDEPAVCNLLNKSVPEAIFRLRPAPLLHDQVAPLELGQSRTQRFGGSQAPEELQAEGAPDDRGDVHELAGARLKPVQPRLERLLDRRRDGDSAIARDLETTVYPPQGTALDQVAKRLLDEERIAACTFGEQRAHCSRQLCGGRALCQLDGSLRLERLEIDLQEAVAKTPPRVFRQIPAAMLALGA